MTQAQRLLFIVASVLMVTLLPISAGAMAYGLYFGVNIWWALPLGYIGCASWLVHVALEGKVRKYLKSLEDGREET